MSGAAPRPPFDPDVSRALDDLADAIVVDMAAADIPRVRGLAVAWPEAELTRHGAFTRSEAVAPGAPGDPDVPVAVYRPAQGTGPHPVLLALHGGGLVAGHLDSDTPPFLELAHQAGCAVVTVEYRLAPEHPFPAALDDATAVLAWLAGPDRPDGLDPARIVLAGVSAGGGLAATAALHARDHGGPAIAGLLLLCPMLDHRSDSFSAHQLEGVGSWDRRANATAWSAYLGAAAADPPAGASAASAASLAGLPPTFIDVGSAETFRDECVAFADRLWREGGDAELHVWPGGAHAFDFLAPWAAMANEARAARLGWLRRLLARL